MFVVDENTARLSETERRCMLRCHYREPSIMDRGRTEDWKVRTVGLDELVLDLERQRAYWFDFEAAAA